MKAKTFIVILSLLAIITLSILLIYSLFGSGTGGIIELYHSKKITEIKIDSLVNSKNNLENITGEEYFESLNYDGEGKNYFKNNYNRFQYIIYSSSSEKIIFRYKLIDSSLALVSATKKGKFFKLARDINYWDKYSYKVTFKREIINQLKIGM